jgi:hypothetical protein
MRTVSAPPPDPTHSQVPRHLDVPVLPTLAHVPAAWTDDILLGGLVQAIAGMPATAAPELAAHAHAGACLPVRYARGSGRGQREEGTGHDRLALPVMG